MIDYRRRISSFILVFFLTLFSYQNILLAQKISPEYKLNKEFFIKFKEDFKETLLSPKGWEKKDFINFSSVLGAAILFYALDQDSHDWIQDHRSSVSDNVSKIISYFGHGAFISGLIAVLYTSGEFSNNNTLRKTALLSLESYIISGVFVLSLKFVTGRARPHTGESKSAFHLFSMKSSYNSFPSGHASSAFAVATTIADQSEETFVDIFVYSLATLVALSRIHDNAHWASDVLVGSAIGYFVGKKISALNRGHNNKKLKVGFHFFQGRPTISLSLSF